MEYVYGELHESFFRVILQIKRSTVPEKVSESRSAWTVSLS